MDLAHMLVQSAEKRLRGIRLGGLKMAEMNIFETQERLEEIESLLKANPIRKTIDEICKDIVEQKNNVLAMDFAKTICGILRENKIYVHFTEARAQTDITTNSITKKIRNTL